MCGERVSFQFGSERGYGFAEYVQGHHVRDTNGFHTEEGLRRSTETRREQYRSGEREPWNKGMTLESNPEHENLRKLRRINLKENNPERAQRISEALQGHEVSEETQRRIAEANREAWTDEMREEQRQRRYERMEEHNLSTVSQLEEDFNDILDAGSIAIIGRSTSGASARTSTSTFLSRTST